MPVTANLPRLLEMSQELRLMGFRGVNTRKLGRIALDILVSKAAASRLAQSESEDEREWAKRSLEYLNGLEAEAVRLYSNLMAQRRRSRRLQRGIGLDSLPS